MHESHHRPAGERAGGSLWRQGAGVGAAVGLAAAVSVVSGMGSPLVPVFGLDMFLGQLAGVGVGALVGLAVGALVGRFVSAGESARYESQPGPG